MNKEGEKRTYSNMLTVVIFIAFFCSNFFTMHLYYGNFLCISHKQNTISKMKIQKKKPWEQLMDYMFSCPSYLLECSLLWHVCQEFTRSVLRLKTKQLLRGDDKDVCHLVSVLFQHTTVLPFILIEMRTSHHEYPSRRSGLTAICTFSVGYILW